MMGPLPSAPAAAEFRLYRVTGFVQGVGFRPFVYRAALRCKLAGLVANDALGVTIELEGPPEAIDDFLGILRAECPPLASIHSVTLLERSGPVGRHSTFAIGESRAVAARRALVLPDFDVCADCLGELFDPADRRYRYPFINCTNCGPRYSIIEEIPYDRRTTTMKAFRMCAPCEAEYHDPASRRFHAQPNACWDCGPRFALRDADGHGIAVTDPLEAAADHLRAGAIVAMKGLGGYHLLVDPANAGAVVELRRRKARDEKPFALMSASLTDVETYATLNAHERAALTCRERPITLVRKSEPERFADAVAPRNRHYGVMLAYTPAQHLLLRGRYPALVATSANVSDEPIAFKDADALERLHGIADYFLTHDREIHTRLDDSIVRVIPGGPSGGHRAVIRRARGYAPAPVAFPRRLPAILGFGAELKNTVCLTREHELFLSQHIGDLKNDRVFHSALLAIDHLKALLEIEPQLVACDLHPAFVNTQYARAQRALPVVSVQHHHAHMAACLCEHGLDGPALGVIFDGMGYGTDGRAWGGEFLVGGYREVRRAAHFRYFPLPGGDRAVHEPFRIAIALLTGLYGDAVRELPLGVIRRRDPFELGVLVKMTMAGLNAPLTSSVGRLFDAVSALTGVREVVTYEGQAAIELEQVGTLDLAGVAPFGYEVVRDGDTYVIDVARMLHELVAALTTSPADVTLLSRRFHRTLVTIVVDVCQRLRADTGLALVVLSGGVFLNETLSTWCERALGESGFTVASHAAVPCNDGGISLGQCIVAAHAV